MTKRNTGAVRKNVTMPQKLETALSETAMKDGTSEAAVIKLALEHHFLLRKMADENGCVRVVERNGQETLLWVFFGG